MASNKKDRANDEDVRDQQPHQQQTDAPPGSWIVKYDDRGHAFWQNNENGQKTCFLAYLPSAPGIPTMIPHQQPAFVPAYLPSGPDIPTMMPHQQPAFGPAYLPSRSGIPATVLHQQPAFVPASAPPMKKSPRKKNAKSSSKDRGFDNGGDGEWKGLPTLPRTIRMHSWEELTNKSGKKFWRHYESGKRTYDDPFV